MNTRDSSMQVDFLIVGQGLAGSLLTWSLMNEGYSVYVVDNNHRHSSSIVAAGLINPVTGKRLVKAADTDNFLKQLHITYSELEVYFKRQFYYPLDMLRFMKDASQQATLLQRQSDKEYNGFIGACFEADKNSAPLKNNFGGCLQKHTGYLDIPALLTSLNELFLGSKIISHHRLDYHDIVLNDDTVQWQHIQARFCIFCEGYKGTGNPWFNWLPFQPAKGEILTVESDQINIERIINRSNWLIPIGNKQFRTGSTNSWDYSSDEPTENGRREIESNLQGLFTHQPNYQVVRHQAGVRPATRDKNPFIGFHPEIRQLAIFNGFGARGSLTMPWFSRVFTKAIKQQKALPGSVDIKRFYPT
jgi:glycine/D-amino acid oxidase-like deaminating enzyme